ncbi:hypothetical protein HAX54_007626 [Datura stramonium]|uniref:Uncharacterized protein n=1 Tax=Datura stramonium TaxID=4076 RepID=A0ABS8TDE1_DATST|nr:hypothetical protein [Datura stramonium]
MWTTPKRMQHNVELFLSSHWVNCRRGTQTLQFHILCDLRFNTGATSFLSSNPGDDTPRVLEIMPVKPDTGVRSYFLIIHAIPFQEMNWWSDKIEFVIFWVRAQQAFASSDYSTHFDYSTLMEALPLK